MKSRPILFSAPMVRALLDGSKTQTRRVVKGSQAWPANTHHVAMLESRGTAMAVDARRCSYAPEIKCPYGKPGDQLWVRESFAHIYRTNDVPGARSPEDVAYMADNMTPDRDVYGTWKPGIHMPRWASRITLEITGVRVERLNSISEADAKAEGAQLSEGGPCPEPEFQSHTLGFWRLWESINGPGSWNANLWVWVVKFKRVTP